MNGSRLSHPPGDADPEVQPPPPSALLCHQRNPRPPAATQEGIAPAQPKGNSRRPTGITPQSLRPPCPGQVGLPLTASGESKGLLPVSVTRATQRGGRGAQPRRLPPAPGLWRCCCCFSLTNREEARLPPDPWFWLELVHVHTTFLAVKQTPHFQLPKCFLMVKPLIPPLL